MGLGDLLFNKKQSTTQARGASSLPKKKNIDDVVLTPRYGQERSFRGMNMKSLKGVKIDGRQFSKSDLKGIMSSITKSTRRDVSYKDLVKFIKDPRRNKIIKGWNNKKKFLEIEKKIAERKSRQYKTTSSVNNRIAPIERLKQEQKNTRITNAMAVIEERKFISPKQKSALASAGKIGQKNSLGMEKKGFQRGHGGSLQGMGALKASGEKPQARGLTQTSNSGIVRNAPRGLEANGINPSINPRRGGL